MYIEPGGLAELRFGEAGVLERRFGNPWHRR
jgi:hypothetical protein